MTRAGAWWRWARQWRREQLVESTDRIAVLEHVHDAGRLGPRYAFMTVMSSGIAMLGLLQNSVAVIIGAMLVSPLMGPIVQLGMGLATFELRGVREALRTLLAGVALALAIAILIVLASPLKAATSEILARTQPTFFDLLVAVFSGLAGAYATVTRKGETIVGVAIATALMPPLAVAGYGTALGNWHIAGGAAFLFMTNLLAIALSVTIVARLYGFGGSDSPKQTAWQAALIVASFALLSIPLGVALKRIATQSQTELLVRAEVESAARAASGRLSVLRVDTSTRQVAVEAVLMLPAHQPGLEARMQRALETRLRRTVDLRVQEVLVADEASIARQQGTLAELRRSVAALQDAESLRGEARRTRAEQRARLAERLLPFLGRLQRSEDGSRWDLWLSPTGGLSLTDAWRMETAANTGLAEGEAALVVHPPLQPLPPIPLPAEPDTDDAAAREALGVQAWALQRWRTPAVDARLATPDDAVAQAWETRLRAQLAARGIALARLERERTGAPRLALALPQP